jgi:hypothetical protein
MEAYRKMRVAEVSRPATPMFFFPIIPGSRTLPIIPPRCRQSDPRATEKFIHRMASAPSCRSSFDKIE